jgi:outer membrane protein assembly factor BamB
MKRQVWLVIALLLVVVAFVCTTDFDEWLAPQRIIRPRERFSDAVPASQAEEVAPLLGPPDFPVGESFDLAAQSGRSVFGWRGMTTSTTSSSTTTAPLNEHTSAPNALPTSLELDRPLWQVDCGPGHASPIAFDNRVFVLGAGVDGCQLREFDLATGLARWTCVLTEQPLKSAHAKGAPASATPASDGSSIFVAWSDGARVSLTKVSGDGAKVWEIPVGLDESQWGFNASPIFYRGLVIVSLDNWQHGSITAFDAQTGQTVWRQPRPSGIEGSYSSPLLIHPVPEAVNARTIQKSAQPSQATATDAVANTYSPSAYIAQAGLGGVAIFDAASGRSILLAPVLSDVSAATPVSSDGVLLATSGHRDHQLVALIIPPSSTALTRQEPFISPEPTVLWKLDKPNEVPYVPSPLIVERSVILVTDAGIAASYELRTGQRQWRVRLGGTFTASPILVPTTAVVSQVLLINEAGEYFLLESLSGQKLKTGNFGQAVFATPIIVGDRLIVRSESKLSCFQ